MDLPQAPGATVTLDSGSVTTAAQLGSGAWAIGSATISAGEVYTLSGSQVFSAGSSDLLLDGTPVHRTVPDPTTTLRPTGLAVLTGPDTTVTAYQVAGTTGLAVIDGQTVSYSGSGITLDSGEVVSMSGDGAEDGSRAVEFSSTTGLRFPMPATDSTRSVELSTTTGQVYPIPGTSSELPSTSESIRSTGLSADSSTISGGNAATTTPGTPSSASAEDTGSGSSTAASTDASSTSESGGGRVHLTWSSCCLAALLLFTFVL